MNEIENGLVEADAKQTKMTVHIYDHFNMANAKADFEKRFQEKTGNKWSERDFFKEKPGKFKLLDKVKKKQQIKEAF